MALTANPLHFSGQFCVERFSQIAKSPCLGMLLTTVPGCTERSPYS